MNKNNYPKLELNPNDSKLNTKNIPKSRKDFKRKLSGVLAGIMMFSGSALSPVKAYANEVYTPDVTIEQEYLSENEIVDIPEIYKYTVADLVGKDASEPVTVHDLENAQKNFLDLHVKGDSSLNWLKYLKNVDFITFILEPEDENTKYPFDTIEKIDGVRAIEFLAFNNYSLRKSDCEFIKNCKDCTTLCLNGPKLEYGVIENLTQLKDLIMCTPIYSNIDYSKLTFLDNLDFAYSGAYDAAIYFNSKDYNTLKDAGVNINFDNPDQLSKLEKINDKLDKIIDKLDVTMDSTDTEKLNQVLIYVLETYEYSSDINKLSKEASDLYQEATLDAKEKNLPSISDEYKEKLNKLEREDSALVQSFYKEGVLYGAMEGNEIICGNYTAITNALLDRLGINCEFLESGEKGDHAWSLVEIDNQYYYVDSTWLDSSNYEENTEVYVDSDGQMYSLTTFKQVQAEEYIKEGKTKDLSWYKEDPTNYPINSKHPDAHEATNLPNYIQIKPIVKTEEDKEESNEFVEPEVKPEIEPEVKPIPSYYFEEPTKITEDNKFEVIIKDKRFIIGGSTLLGILTALGVTVAVKHNKRKKEMQRRMNDYNNLYGYNDYYDSQSNTYYRGR